MPTTQRIADADAEALALIRDTLGQTGRTRHIDIALLPEVAAGLAAISADLLRTLARYHGIEPETLLDRVELHIRERELA